MAFIADGKIREIRDRIRLEELVRDYNILLQPAGGSSRWKGLCPFHHEKTPSFHVDADKQLFHCFGCKAGGDVFHFLQRIEHVDFAEAAEMLARKAGVILEYAGRGGAGPRSGARSALYQALELAEAFFHRILMEDARGEPARKYLEARGIHRASWERFRLGYSLPEWDALLRHALGKGIAQEVLEGAGLARQAAGDNNPPLSPPRASTPPDLLLGEARGGAMGRRRVYDAFRGRLMFPIADGQKRVVGFGARTLSGDDQPKYINTPKTAVFDKSQVLYALPQARAAIEKEKRIAIVEGYTDAILAHQEGLEFFVASLGTAFTAENARRLRRLAPRVEVIFDGDFAGQSAAERSLSLLVEEDLDVRVYTVVNGKDPCDAIRELGGGEFRRRLDDQAVGIFEFKWMRTVGAIPEDARSAGATARALDPVLDLLLKVPNVVARKLYAREFAERLGIPAADIERRLGSLAPARRTWNRASQPAGGMSSKPMSSGPMSGQTGAAPAAAASLAAAAGTMPALENPSLEEVVLECLLADPGTAADRWSALPEGFFRDPGHKGLAAQIGDLIAAGRFDLDHLAAAVVEPEAVAALARILGRIEQTIARAHGDPGDPGRRLALEEVWERCLRDHRRQALRLRRRELEGLKVRARAEGDAAGLLAAEREYRELLKEMAAG